MIPVTPWMRYIQRLTFQNTSEDYVVVLSINLKNILLVSTFQFPLEKPLTNGLYMPGLSNSEGARNADWIKILHLQTRAIITAMLLKRATCWIEYTIHCSKPKNIHKENHLNVPFCQMNRNSYQCLDYLFNHSEASIVLIDNHHTAKTL